MCTYNWLLSDKKCFTERYEVDFMFTYLKKEDIKELISLYLKLEATTVPLHLLKKEPVALPMRLFKHIVNFYIWFLAPRTNKIVKEN